MSSKHPTTASSCGLDLPHRTARLTLRGYRPDDVDDSFAYYSRPDVVAYVPWETWTRADAERRVAERATRTRLDGPGSVLSLVVEHRGRLIGDVVLWPADDTMSRGEMGWAFHPDAGGHGYATDGG